MFMFSKCVEEMNICSPFQKTPKVATSADEFYVIHWSQNVFMIKPFVFVVVLRGTFFFFKKKLFYLFWVLEGVASACSPMFP